MLDLSACISDIAVITCSSQHHLLKELVFAFNLLAPMSFERIEMLLESTTKEQLR
jgi:hypothetical protein